MDRTESAQPVIKKNVPKTMGVFKLGMFGSIKPNPGAIALLVRFIKCERCQTSRPRALKAGS